MKLWPMKTAMRKFLYPPTGAIRWILLLTALVGLTACAKPQPTVVVLVGGLGMSQLGDVKAAVKQRCPEADVVSAGWWDAYKEDPAALAREKPRERIIMVGHSFGCKTVAEAAAKLPAIDLAIFIEPAWNDVTVPRNVRRVLWFQRSEIGFTRKAKILAGVKPVVINGGHNTVTESPTLISGIVEAINQVTWERQASARNSSRATR